MLEAIKKEITGKWKTWYGEEKVKWVEKKMAKWLRWARNENEVELEDLKKGSIGREKRKRKDDNDKK